MAQVKFFRGNHDSYTPGGKYLDAVYFSKDTMELLLNGVSYGVSKTDLAKLDAAVKSVNYDDASRILTVAYNGKQAASTIELPLATADKAGLMSAADKAALDTLNGAVNVEGSVKKLVADALESANDYADSLNKSMDSRVDVLETMVGLGDGENASLSEQVAANATAILANADAIDAIEADYLKAADKNELYGAISTEVTNRENAISGLKTELLGEVDEGDAKTIAALNDKIEEVEGAAKSYSIVAVTEGLGTNVQEAWKLVDEDGAQAGAQINIYKDSSLRSVALVEQELQFTYILADGKESTVGVDVSKFLAESEFGNGLEVNELNGTVAVKVDETSEEFLTVGEGGIKVSGVQDAIDTAVAAEKTRAEAAEKVNADAITTNETAISNEIARATGVEERLAGRIADLEEAVGEGGDVATQIADAVKVETDRATGEEAKIRSEFADADATVKSNAAADATTKANQALADAKAYTDEEINKVEEAAETLANQVETNKTDIATLNGTGEGSVAKAVADAKAVIDGYTVNDKAIFGNPRLYGSDIKVGTYTEVADNDIDITANSTIAEALKALEDAWAWNEEA